MIFPPSIARAVLRGEVTQTRRPVQARDPYYRQSRKLKSTGRSRILVQPYKPNDGDRFPIQQRVHINGRPTTETRGHAIIASATIIKADDLTLHDAREMGYRTTSEAMAAWLTEHDQAWVCEDTSECQACGGPGVHRTGFCVTCGCDDQPAARFARRHADRDVWAIRFELDNSHVPRLLGVAGTSPAPRKGDTGLPTTSTSDADRGYVTTTSRALRGDADAGEALTDTDHERHVEANATITHEQWRALEHAARNAELERLSLGRRLDRAIAEAQQDGRSISREVNVIEKRLRALERGPARRAA